jgi:YidC/Oxa1 family membrane protein insertase
MDKNSIIGIFLIFGILVLFTIINKPSEEEIAEAKRRRDSIETVEREKEKLLQQQAENKTDQIIDNQPDSVDIETVLKQKSDQLGVFGQAAIGEEEYYTVENNLMKITFSNKGGRIYSVELKDYMTYDSLPVVLLDCPDTKY